MVATAKKINATTKPRKTKQSSPVRLSETFYKRMEAVAKINSRSIPKQLEHMVGIAEGVADYVSPEELLDIQAGLSKIVVEKIEAPRIDKTALFNSLDSVKKSGALSRAVTQAETTYQASTSHPGYLERINKDGSRDIGQFTNGQFNIAKDLT